MSNTRYTGPTGEIYLRQAMTFLQYKALDVWLATHCNRIEKRRSLDRRDQAYHDEMRERRELLLLQLGFWADETSDAGLATALDQLCRVIKQNEIWMWDFGVTNGEQLGATQPITQSQRLFTLTIAPFEPSHWQQGDIAEVERLYRALGYLPQQTIQIRALNNRQDDHLLMGYMLADLAFGYEGRVRLSLQPQFQTEYGAAQWTPHDTYQLITGFPGSVVEIHTPKRNDSTRSYFLADCEFTLAWVQHPRFYLS